MGTVYRIAEMQTYAPGMYDLVKVEPVGNYAIRLYWGDGHDSGIYDWTLLEQLCQQHGLSEAEIQQAQQRESEEG